MAHDEFSLIRQWTRRSDGQEGDGLTVGIGDDAAVFTPTPAMEVVACCDAMVETVHFLKETMHPSDIGYKAVISNISDIAAMGGLARYALVSIAVSPNWSATQTSQIYDGIYEACEEYEVRLIGGDTVSAPDALHLSVTVLGEVEKGRAIRRSQAQVGQAVFVTGYVGSSAAGLHLLLQQKNTGEGIPNQFQQLIQAHQRPTAQVTAGRLLLTSQACGALNDVSDGLASELWEIAEASRVELCVDASLIPISEELSSYAEQVGKDPLDWAFYGGEDYQLVGTVDAVYVDTLREQFAAAGIPFSVIGRVESSAAEASVTCKREGRQMPLPKAGFNHFGQRE
ncbi:thiamine-phosphate kinase [Brevibacillus choshinensis]|uniref:thiamine-phosphate kinase n=1 Tax=Brevibacillus choshinensis TaxID=54911 RepID=UPI002E1E9D17|nr:thiamine-phosphate kinase [Brevibacillus choshinensis]